VGGISYLDFDLLIQRADGKYRAQVDSPGGQAAVTFSLPFSDIELENFLLRVGRARRVTRRLDSPEVQAAKNFGERLFAAVFADQVRDCLRTSLDEARQQGGGLRVRFHLTDTPELADLPWEYLYDPTLNRFLSLSVDTPVVRYLDLPERIQPLLVSPPLQVLAMISSPHDYPALEVDQEWNKLQDALGELVQRGVVALQRLPEPRLSTLQQYLRRGTYHIFHFIGHGGFDANTQDGVLVLEDEDGRGRLVSGQDLGLMLHDHRSMRLAVLNACEGARTSRTDPFAGSAQSLVQQGLAAVIAMQFEISDEAAITFAHEFYGAVADGYPVDAALVEARKAIFAEDNGLEWGTPVLYLRSPDGRIFDVDKARAPSSTRSAAAFAPTGAAGPATAPARPVPAPQEVPAPPIRPPEPREPAPAVTPQPAAATSGAEGARVPVEPGRRRKVLFRWAPVAGLLIIGAVALVVRTLPGILTAPPAIDQFAVEPAAITLGETVTLRWQVRNAERIEIVPRPETGRLDPRQGEVTVKPAARGPQAFALTAHSGGRSVERAVAISVRMRAPAIKAFGSVVDRSGGHRVMLSWEVADATAVKIEPQPGPVPTRGSAAVDPPPAGQQVTYRLTAVNPDNPGVEKVLVVSAAPRPPVVGHFDAQPKEVRPGQETMLSWNVPGADAAVISGLGPVRVPSGSAAVSPQSTTRYTLTASNADGSVTQTLTVRVRAISLASSPSPTPTSRIRAVPTLQASGRPRASPAPPASPVPRAAAVEIREFGASPAALNPGETAQLCWTLVNARVARIEPDVGEVDPKDLARGCRAVSPRETTTYTLTATGPDGRTASAQFNVEVRPLDIHVDLVVAKPSLIAGESTQLCWVLFNARSARLDPIGDVSPAELEKGCRTITPRETTTYTLTVVGRDGRTVTKQLTVDVRVVEVQIREFSAKNSIVRFGESTQLCWVVVNARTLRIDPEPGDLNRSELERGCRDISPRETTTYFLTAVGPDGRQVTRRVLVVVAR
jgi:hypothetical protein